jgi:23S rRNA (cytidine1920-2'-O)/16S rRNA (cytidine1409-2'-O)-methyltransferase
MMKQRLDKLIAQRGLAATRSEAESWIRLGRVRVNGRVVQKAGEAVAEDAQVTLDAPERYVSRAGLKLASVARALELDFKDVIVLDVGSSTGGFTDYALQHGAKKVFAVDVGTDQLHPKLRADARIELHEKTDIRDFVPSETPDIVVIDVIFISLRDILPHIARLTGPQSRIAAMVKPQFEAGRGQLGSSGVVKNDTIRRTILKDFEQWAKGHFVILNKADSDIAGANGNRERFYLLKPIA